MSYPESPARGLIVNADDFGQSPGINAGVIEAHRHGIVTSTSLMVRWPVAPEAAAYARSHPDLSVGLHVDLGEWEQLGAEWFPRYQVVNPNNRAAVEHEILQQLEQFRELMGRDPTHVDGHQHVQKSGYPGEILVLLAERLGVVLRGRSHDVTYEGSFYGRTASGETFPEGVSIERLVEIIESLPVGLTELGCHPGLGADVKSDYAEERALEVEALCHPRVRAAIERSGIELQSFAELASRLR